MSNALAAGNGPNLPASLRAQYAHILPRLLLIPEFAAWFDLCAQYLPSSVEPLHHLWFCFCLGAPLCTLLELLGVHTSGKLAADSEHFEMEDSTEDRRTALVASFIQGIRMLELQNRISHGEVFRTEHLFDRSAIGFAKVLKTVERVLQSLEATYPGIFVLGDDSRVRCKALKHELAEKERIYLSHLISIAVSSMVPDFFIKRVNAALTGRRCCIIGRVPSSGEPAVLSLYESRAYARIPPSSLHFAEGNLERLEETQLE